MDEIEGREEGEKTIIFSQFTSMLDLIQPFLRHRGVKFVRCEFRLSSQQESADRLMVPVKDDGSMSKDQREAALTTIRTSGSVRVILISFKAGSTGRFIPAMIPVQLINRPNCSQGSI